MMTSRFSQVFLCAAASTRMIDGGNNKIRYRFQGGVVGVTPRTMQSSAQNVAAGFFPTYSKVLFPLLFKNRIFIFTCKEQKCYDVFVVVVFFTK